MNKKSKMIISQNIIFYTFFAIFLLLSSPSLADQIEYEEATIRRLTNHLFEEKMIDFEASDQFKEYTMIEDCGIFKAYFNNDFEWNRIRLAVKSEMEALKPSVTKTRIRVPGKIDLARYNFTTQSFDVHEVDVFDNVGFLQISENRYKLCDGDYAEGDLKAIPHKYYLKPDIPFNLFRIPVSKTVARQILDTVPPNRNETRTIYIDINTTLDAFFDISAKNNKKFAHVLGSVDSVDFYTDARRKNKFKTLYYDEY